MAVVTQETQMKPGSFNLTNDRSLIEFGKLVKQWSTNTKPRPLTLVQFKEQLDEANIQYQLAPEIEAIHLVDRQEGVFSILLPLERRLNQTEETGEDPSPTEYQSGDSIPSEDQSSGEYAYPIPRGYSRLQIDTTTEPGKIEGITECKWDSFNNHEEFDDFRVGDYCSSQCG